MNFLMLAATESGVAMHALYDGAAAAMSGYCGWIASQSDTQDPECDAALTCAKRHALAWFSAVDPERLALPAAVVAADTVVSPALKTLSRLALQLRDDVGAQPLRQAVSACASDICATASGLAGRAGALAGALDAAAEMLTADGRDFHARMQDQERHRRDVEVNLSRLYGALHAAASARCPDRNHIASLRMDIGTGERDLDTALHRIALMRQAESRTHDALHGTNYLAHFWTDLAAEARASAATLARLQREPAGVLDLDIPVARTQWSQLVHDFDQVARAAR